MTHPMPIGKKFVVDYDGIEWIVSRTLIPSDSCFHAMDLDRFYCRCEHYGKIVVSHFSSRSRRDSTPEMVVERANNLLRS